MAGVRRYLAGSFGIYGDRRYVGSEEWHRAFPNGVTRVPSTPVTGFPPYPGIPEADTTRNPNTGNPWQRG